MPMVPEAEEKEVGQERWSRVVGEGFGSFAIPRTPVNYSLVDMEIMDDILQHEGQQLASLISRLEESSSTAMEQEETETTENYGTDDEEYVSLCMEAVSAIEARDTVTDDTQEASSGYFQDMDMSSG